ncbi:MAG: hypothetical protein AABX31_01155 [Nanoarchaeota archaeon]
METVQTSGNRTVAPILLDNGLQLDGEAVRDANGKYLQQSQQGWEKHFAGTGKHIPTVSEYVSTIKQLDERGDHASQGLLQDLRESWLCAGKIDYNNSNLPSGSGYLNQLVKDPAWKRALEDELFHYDAHEAVSVLQTVTGKRPYIWTPGASGRKSHPERAAWLVILTDRFYLSCGSDPIDGNGRSRGVREGGAAGARVEKKSSLEEEKLHSRIEEELSRFDEFVGTYGQDKYARVKQEVKQNLKGLYKK